MLQTQLTRVERRKEKTRKVLLEVALELFHAKGIYWTKIEDITERADIGKGTFYQYFSTKEDLLEVLLQQGLDALLARTAEALAASTEEHDSLTKIIHAQLDFHSAHKEYLLLFHQVRGLLQFTTESVKNLRRVYAGYLDRLGTLITPIVRGHETIRSLTDREFAMAISAFTLGLLTHHLVFDQNREFAEHRDHIQSQLQRSLQALL